MSIAPAVPMLASSASKLPKGHPELKQALFVYRTLNLQLPVISLPLGSYPKAAGFDSVGGRVFAANSQGRVLVFDSRGRLQEGLLLDGKRVAIRQILPHSSGRALLLLTENKLLLVRGE